MLRHWIKACQAIAAVLLALPLHGAIAESKDTPAPPTANWSTIGMPATACANAAPPESKVSEPLPGAWRSADRYATGWDFFRKSDGAIGAVFYTYDAQRRPVWYLSTGAHYEASSRGWRADLVHLTRDAKSGELIDRPVGAVAVRLDDSHTDRVQIRWQLDGQTMPVDECLFDRHDETGGWPTLPLVELWTVDGDNRAALVTSRPGLGARLQVLSFDVDGQPVWTTGYAADTHNAPSVALSYRYGNYPGKSAANACTHAGCVSAARGAGVAEVELDDTRLRGAVQLDGHFREVAQSLQLSLSTNKREPLRPSSAKSLSFITVAQPVGDPGQTRTCTIPSGAQTCEVRITWNSTTSGRPRRVVNGVRDITVLPQFNFTSGTAVPVDLGPAEYRFQLVPWATLSPPTSETVTVVQTPETPPNTNTPLDYPPPSACPTNPNPVAPGSTPGVQGRWWNPSRAGTHWEIYFTNPDANGNFSAYVYWLTFSSDMKPEWLMSNTVPVESVNGAMRFRSPLIRFVWNGNAPSGTHVGDVAITFVPGDATRAALRWRWDGGATYVANSPIEEECLSEYSRDGFRAPEKLNQTVSGHWVHAGGNGSGYLVYIGRGASGSLYEAGLLLAYGTDNQPRWAGYERDDLSFGTSSDIRLLQIRQSPFANGVPRGEPTGSQPRVDVGSMVRSFSSTTLGVASFTANLQGWNWVRGSGDITKNAGSRLTDVVVDRQRCTSPCQVRVSWTSNLPNATVRRTRIDVLPQEISPVAQELASFRNVDFAIPGTYRFELTNGPSGPVVATSATVQVDPSTSAISAAPTVCTAAVGASSCNVSLSWATAAAIPSPVGVFRERLPFGPVTPVRAGRNSANWVDSAPATKGAATLYRYRLMRCATADCTTPTSEVMNTEVTVVGASPAGQSLVANGIAPHDATVGVVAANASVVGGSASVSIPIEVPPGRRAMQPDVSLNYASRSGGGVAGIGVNLSAASSIHRCPRTVAQDNEIRAVDMSSSDRLCLDGQRLVVVNGVAYGTNGAQYRTEIDSYVIVLQIGDLASSSTASFEVRQKNGELLRYGFTNATTNAMGGGRVLVTHPSQGAQTWAWALEQRRDLAGHTIDYRYQQYAGAEYHLRDIRYTGTSLAPGNRRVEFVYTPRPAQDATSGYVARVPTPSTQRLSQINTFGPVPLGNVVHIRRYQLNYIVSLSSQRALLDSVTECAMSTGNAVCKPPTTLGWQHKAPELRLERLALNNLPLPPGVAANWANTVIRLDAVGDIDGDGIVEHTADIKWTNPSTGVEAFAMYLISTDSQGTIRSAEIVPTSGSGHLLAGPTFSGRQGDFNNDGRADFWGYGPQNQIVIWSWANNGGSGLLSNLAQTQTSITFAVRQLNQPALLDVNADGFTDLVGAVDSFAGQSCGTGSYLVWHPNRASGAVDFAPPQFLTCLQRYVGIPLAQTPYEHLGDNQDFDGNGIVDLFIREPVPAPRLALSNLNRIILLGRTPAGAVTQTTIPKTEFPVITNNATTGQWFDVNGDGLSDWLFGAGTWQVALNQGGKLGDPINTGQSAGLNIVGNRDLPVQRTLDVNSDGRQEILLPVAFEAMVCQEIFTEPASGTFCPRPERSPGCELKTVCPLPHNRENFDGVFSPSAGLGAVVEKLHEYDAPDRSIYRLQAYRFVETIDAQGNISIQMPAVTMAQPILSDAFPSSFGSGGSFYGDGLASAAGFFGCPQNLNPNTLQTGICRVIRPSDLTPSALQGSGTFSYWQGYDDAVPTFPTPTSLPQFFGTEPTMFVNRNLGAGVRSGTLPPLAPDLLRSVTDGFNKESIFEYLPLSSHAGRGGDLPLYSVPARSSGTGYVDAQHFYFTSSMNVVSEFLQSDAAAFNGNTMMMQRYGYQEAMYNNQGRGFAGFRRIIVDQIPDGPRTESKRVVTTYRQKFPLVGQTERVRVFGRGEPFALDPTEVIALPGCKLGSRPADYTGSDTPIELTMTRWQAVQPVANIGVYAPQAVQNQSSLRGLGARTEYACTISSETTDALTGNVTSRNVVYRDAFGTRTTQESFAYDAADTTATGWWLDKLLSHTTTSNATWTQAPTPAGSLEQIRRVELSNYNGFRLPATTIECGVGANCSTALPRRVTTREFKPSNTPAAGQLHRETIVGVDERSAQTVPRTTTTDYDSSGYFVASVLNPANHLTEATHDPRFGTPTLVTDPNRQTTSTTLDDFGRTIKQIQSQTPAVPLTFGLSRCTLQEGCAYRMETRRDGAPTTIAWFDRLGREYRKRETLLSEDGQEMWRVTLRREYDNQGRVVAEAVPHFEGPATPEEHRQQFDLLDRVVSRAIPSASGFQSRSYAYDGLTTSITSSAGPGGAPANSVSNFTVTRTVRPDGQVLATTDGLAQPVVYRYDGAGLPRLIVDPRGVATSASYNPLGYRTEMIDPDQGRWTFEYNGLGELTKQTDARGHVTSFQLDTLGRIATRTAQSLGVGAVLDTFVWDTLNGSTVRGALMRSTRTEPDGASFVRTLGYDGASRPISTHEQIALPGWQGQPAFQQSFISYQDYDPIYGWIRWSSDGAGVPSIQSRDRYGDIASTEVVTPTGPKLARKPLGQDAFGNTTNVQLGNGLRERSMFSANTGALIERCWGAGPACEGQPLTLRYVYDDFGNLVERSLGGNWVSGTVPTRVSERLSYDALHRLKQTDRQGGSFSATESVSYSYDPIGNLLSKGDTGTYTYTANTSRLWRVTRMGGAQLFEYDNNGNQITASTEGVGQPFRRIDYDNDNLPIAIEDSISNMLSRFHYGSDLQRYAQRRGASLLRINAAGAEFDFSLAGGGWSPTVTRSSVDGVLVTQQGGSTTLRWLHQDRLGSALAKTNQSGQPETAELVEFDVWGKPRNANYTNRQPAVLATPASPRGFTGHEHLDQVRLIHMNGRLFDYDIGRFLGVDPIIQFPLNSQSLNPYSYIMNNPLAGTDPTGYAADVLWDAGNVIYDIGKIGFGLATGNDELVEEGTIDLAIDSAAMLIPFVPAGAGKLARVADDTNDLRRGSTIPEGTGQKSVAPDTTPANSPAGNNPPANGADSGTGPKSTESKPENTERIGDATAVAAKNVVDESRDARVIYRKGDSPETATRLERRATEAENSNIGIHGVSGSTTKPDVACSSATCGQLEDAGFKVHDTPTRNDPNHVTIELPKPVKPDDAKKFNDTLGRKKR